MGDGQLKTLIGGLCGLGILGVVLAGIMTRPADPIAPRSEQPARADVVSQAPPAKRGDVFDDLPVEDDTPAVQRPRAVATPAKAPADQERLTSRTPAGSTYTPPASTYTSPADGTASSPSRSGGTVRVGGYYRKDGTYVRAHTRSRPRRK